MKIVYIGNLLQARGTPTTIDILSQQLINEGYVVQKFSSKKNLILRMVDMCLGFFKNLDAQVVLIDTYSTAAFWYAVLLAFLCRVFKKKYVLYLHGGDLPNRLIKNPRICNWLFSNSNINVAPSNYLYQSFISKGFTNCMVIPNTIEISNYPYKIDRNVINPKILWVRSFSEIYNPTLAIDVLVLLKQKFPNSELCMVGPEKDGSLEKTKQYAKQNNVKVVFTDKLSKKDWVKLSETFNIFLNTTNFDNTPVSVIEAMALGLPVVSTNVGGLPFLINSGLDGILVDPNNALALSDKITQLIQDKNKYKEIANAARLKAEKFDWIEVRKSWDSLFKSID